MNTKEGFIPYMHGEQEKARIFAGLHDMEAQFARELTPELAQVYIGSLKNHIGSAHESYESFVKQGCEVHKKLGKEVYGPVIIGFLQWAQEKLSTHDIDHGPVHFALRDAWPFYSAAHVLWDGSNTFHPVGTYLNRPLLGIEDEIDPEKSIANGHVAQYLNQSGIKDGGDPVALIDSGAWGTVVQTMKQTYLPHTEFYPIFWYSHNPHIAGFLNEMLPKIGLDVEFGEVLNDSMECVFPQQYKRPTVFNSSASGHRLALEKADPLSVVWGQAALEGVVEAAHVYKGVQIPTYEILAGLHRLSLLSQEAKMGIWTGVLPDHTPTWSKGEEFLAAWPKNLLP
jgi:hypothetical protein